MTDYLEAASTGLEEDDSANYGALKQFVTFLVEDRSYGIDITSVREIKQWTPITLLPNQQLYTRGVLNLRGTIVPVYDLRARFTSILTKATENHVIVIVWIGAKTVGILVDAVSDIISVALENIRPVPIEKSSSKPAVISGLVKVNEEMVALIDTNVLFPLDIDDSTS